MDKVIAIPRNKITRRAGVLIKGDLNGVPHGTRVVELLEHWF